MLHHRSALWARRTCFIALALLTIFATASCGGDPEPPTSKDASAAKADGQVDGVDDGANSDAGPHANAAQKALLSGVKETERWAIPELTGEVWVVRTESNVPHIYAENELDLARVHAFVAARDRFFLMDMMRRLALGRLSEVFGDVAVKSDLDSRGTGMTAVAARVLKMMKPEMKALMGAYAEGINAYIAQVAAKKLPPPSELKLAAPLLGYKSPVEAMKPFTTADMAGVLTVILFQQGYETEDLRRAKLRQTLETVADKKPDAALRKAGLIDDVFMQVAPISQLTTTPGYGVNGDKNGAAKAGKADDLTGQAAPQPPVADGPRPLFGGAIPSSLLDRLDRRLSALNHRLGKAERGEFGSNIWVVAGDKSKDGSTLLASDGHLTMQVPSLFWRVGIDTRVLGGGDTHGLGITFAGMPMIGAGTNGDIAWSNTYLYGDITDYYREEITLDSAGSPKSSRFGKESKPLKRIDEVYTTAKIDFLKSPGGDQTWPRWELFDGRRLVSIEGRAPTEGELDGTSKLPQGEQIVAMLGTFIIPKDMNGDGVITGVSMDLTTLDVADTAGAVWGLNHAKSVDKFRAAGRGLVGWAQNMMATDAQGHILYTGYNATPCRAYLERTKDGRFAADADPRLLIDGTKYKGFRIPLDGAKIDEAAGKTDPYACVIPFDQWPVARDPAAGFLVNANNDFGRTSLDGRLGDDPWYLGGPWTLGYRAQAIYDRLKAVVEGKTADLKKMSEIQGTTASSLGAQWAPAMLAAIAKAKQLKQSDADTDPANKRLRALYLAEQVTMDVVADRLKAWQQRGYPAESGVETFYHQPSAQQRTDSVATLLFNAWAVELLHRVYDDEGVAFNGMVAIRALTHLLDGRGANNPKNQASWKKETGESVLFDIADTAEVERSDEVMLLALTDALKRLRAKPSEPGLGGFGTWDVSQWRWGLRHMLHLDSILASFLTGVPGLGALTQMFAISTEVLPLADKLPKGDPRTGLLNFPRPGDYASVDAAHPHAIRSIQFPDSGPRDFRYNHGPSMRMVIALQPGGGVKGANILPGGQSALKDSPFFADQAKLWLANETQPMRFSVEDVVAGATGREVFTSGK